MKSGGKNLQALTSRPGWSVSSPSIIAAGSNVKSLGRSLLRLLTALLASVELTPGVEGVIIECELEVLGAPPPPPPPWLNGVVAVPLVTGVCGALPEDGPAECGVPGLMLCGVSGCRNGWLLLLFTSAVWGVPGFWDDPIGLLLLFTTDLSMLAPPKLSLIWDWGLKKSLATLKKFGVGGPPGPTPFWWS